MNRSAAEKVIRKDLFDLNAADPEGFDVVIDAFGTWTPETLPQHGTSLKHLCDLVSGRETRLLVVGGAGSLYVNQEHTVQVMDGADFPEMFRPLASSMGRAPGELRAGTDVRWMYISPAVDFQADGEKTGKYISGGGELIEDNFPDFIEKDGFRDMYSAGVYQYDTLEECWAYVICQNGYLIIQEIKS